MRASGARNAEGKRDRAAAVALYRRVYERGVNFIDVANIYGYGECEEILAEALYPYPVDLLIGTKAGFKPGRIEPGQRSLPAIGRPEHIKAECELSLRRLRLDCIDLYQVHVPDPEVPYADTVGAFVELQREGKIRHIGVSNVSVAQLAEATSICRGRVGAERLQPGPARLRGRARGLRAAGHRLYPALSQHPRARRCRMAPAAPWSGQPTPAEELVAGIATAHGVSAQQVAVAWLLAHSPVMVPIPGPPRSDTSTTTSTPPGCSSPPTNWPASTR